MGFLDKAKKMAEQAQTKLDEVQTQFNDRQGSGSAMSAGGPPAVEYDNAGRPIPVAPQPEAEATPEPPAAPAAPAAPPTDLSAAADSVAAVADEPAPAAAAPAAPPSDLGAPPAPADDAKDDGPPPMTSGDPLAG